MKSAHKAKRVYNGFDVRKENKGNRRLPTKQKPLKGGLRCGSLADLKPKVWKHPRLDEQAVSLIDELCEGLFPIIMQPMVQVASNGSTASGTTNEEQPMEREWKRCENLYPPGKSAREISDDSMVEFFEQGEEVALADLAWNERITAWRLLRQKRLRETAAGTIRLNGNTLFYARV